jgi:hypothetical protein
MRKLPVVIQSHVCTKSYYYYVLMSTVHSGALDVHELFRSAAAAAGVIQPQLVSSSNGRRGSVQQQQQPRLTAPQLSAALRAAGCPVSDLALDILYRADSESATSSSTAVSLTCEEVLTRAAAAAQTGSAFSADGDARFELRALAQGAAAGATAAAITAAAAERVLARAGLHFACELLPALVDTSWSFAVADHRWALALLCARVLRAAVDAPPLPPPAAATAVAASGSVRPSAGVVRSRDGGDGSSVLTDPASNLNIVVCLRLAQDDGLQRALMEGMGALATSAILQVR